MITLRILLLVVGLPLLVLGGEGLYHFALNREQTTLSCQELAQEVPRVLWLRITGCEVDYDRASIRDPDGQIREMYFPARPAGQPQASPAPLVFATRDPDALAIAQATIGDNRQPDQEAITVMWLRIVTALKVTREVEGYVRAGFLARMLTAQDLAGMSGRLTTPYVALDLHARPSALAPGIEAGAGLVALVGFVALGSRRRRVPAAEAVAEAPPVDTASVPNELDSFAAVDPIAVPVPVPALPDPLQPFGQPPVLEPVLPAMMLLNLDERAGPDAIEHAPPLGPHTDVADRLSNACEGLAFDARGRGVFEGTDFSIAFELGAPDRSPVWTITVRPRGPAAMEAVQALAARTGWRVFVPKQGHFLPALRETTVRS